MKRIYIEASSFYGQRSGVGRYGLSVTDALIRERHNDQFVLFNFLRPGRNIVKDFEIAHNASIRHIRWFPGRAFSLLMRNGISLPLELFGLWRADVVIFPNFIAWASLLGKRRISVVHDIAFEFYPEHIQAKNLTYLRAQLTRSLARSDVIIAVSEATKADLIRIYGIAPRNIVVVYNAVDTTIFNVNAKQHIASLRKTYHLPEQYLLFVGNVEPRKNLEGLLRAYAASYPSHKTALVIVGATGWNNSGIEKKLVELEHLPIYRTDFVTDADLAVLYAGAIGFIYPSFYEGFGLPCLEAMASGCPVICSNVSSLPEVVGDAALTVDPHNLESLATAMKTLVRNKTLRAQLAERGLKQAQKFTWAQSARLLSSIIDKLYKTA